MVVSAKKMGQNLEKGNTNAIQAQNLSMIFSLSNQRNSWRFEAFF